jgi:sensor c-di-GMP phosphodiesterase-like protein
LSPRFQPIVVAESGRIVGAELLLRWKPVFSNSGMSLKRSQFGLNRHTG